MQLETSLTPRNMLYRDLRQNKGSILKASVDYIRRLQRDQERLKVMEERQRQLETTNRKMLLRMQVTDSLASSHRGWTCTGQRAFSVAAPKIWNQIHVAVNHLKLQPSFNKLRHLFEIAFWPYILSGPCFLSVLMYGCA